MTTEAQLLSNLSMVTAHGRVISSMLTPAPAEIYLDDIAIGLARQCRYVGQTLGHISVAEHSVRCAWEAQWLFGDDAEALPGPPVFGDDADALDLIRAALMHDAAEAYVGDMSRQVKAALRALGSTAFDVLEHRWELAVAARFGLRLLHDPRVKQIDNAVCSAEQASKWRRQPAGWAPKHAPAKHGTPAAWGADRACEEFLVMAKAIGIVSAAADEARRSPS